MTLEEWAKTPGLSVFDVECWTVARAISPTRHHARGFVVFATPVPYRVWWFKTPEEIAHWMRRPLSDIVGTVYYETDWMREGLAVNSVS